MQSLMLPTQSTSACDPSPCLPSSKGEPPPKLTLDHQLVHSSQSLSAEPHDFASVDQPTNVEPAPTVMGNEVNPVVNTSGDGREQ